MHLLGPVYRTSLNILDFGFLCSLGQTFLETAIFALCYRKTVVIEESLAMFGALLNKLKHMILELQGILQRVVI